MSSPKIENHSLHPLQREIVLYLSKNGPQTINKTAKKINHDYKPSNIAFHSLEAKGLIKKVSIYSYRNNEYPEFWLTEKGIITALTEGASPTDLLAKSTEVYPKNPTLTLALEMAPYINLDVFRIFLATIINKGKLEPIDLLTILTTQMETEITFDQFMQAIHTYKKYPKEYNQFKRQLSQLRANFNKLADSL
jgi:DNA-binding Lrp family transcriptional regulator